MTDKLNNIKELVNEGFLEFHFYSYSNGSIHHEFFVFDNIVKEWSHDSYLIEESEITKFGLYDEYNLNEYLVTSSERVVRDNVFEDDIICRINKMYDSNDIILKISSKDILLDFMSRKNAFKDTFLYAVNNNLSFKEKNKRDNFIQVNNSNLLHFRFKDNFEKWVKLVADMYDLEIVNLELLKKYLIDIKEYHSSEPQCSNVVDYFAFNIINGYIYKISSGYDDQKGMGMPYVDIIKTYNPKDFLSLSEEEMKVDYREITEITWNSSLSSVFNDGIPF